jgi:hypothetical protein
MQGVLLVEGAVFFQLQAVGGAPFVFGGGIVAPLTFGALKLDDIARHKPASYLKITAPAGLTGAVLLKITR